MISKGKTDTLNYQKKLKVKNNVELMRERMMLQLDQKESTSRAKCFLIGISQEANLKDKKILIKNLEMIADEAENQMHMTQTDKARQNNIEEINDIIHLILKGIMSKLVEKDNVYKKVEHLVVRDRLIRDIERQLESDQVFVARLLVMRDSLQKYIEATKCFSN